MPKDSTRANILEILKVEHTATAMDIAHTLKLTGAAVRYHLSQLEKTGEVIASTDQDRRGPGRPAQVFRLSQTSLPNFLAGLSSALLALQLAQTGVGDEQVWADLARQIAGMGSESPLLTRRLSFSISELNRMNYQARWEAGAHGPRILFSNCPYAAVWPKFPGLCQMDRLLLERWTGRAFLQTHRINFCGHPRQNCIFEAVSG